MSALNSTCKIIFIFFSLIGVSSLLLHLTAVNVKADFGTGGIVTTRIGNVEDRANAVVIQPDGKIVAAGYNQLQFALVRYNSDGSLDTTFGAGGIVTTPIGGGQAYALAIQPDGKLIAAGYSYNGSQRVFALVRYNTNGTLDTSFSGDGKQTTFIGNSSTAYALAVQSDGKIVAAGEAHMVYGDTFGLVRYNSDGSLDTTFGSSGIVTTLNGTEATAYDLQIQPDGKLVAAGWAQIGTERRFALARYNSNGTLDTTFGTGGIVIIIIGNGLEGHSLAIQPDGKFVMAGFPDGLYSGFVLARFNTDGSLDSSFRGGIVTTSYGDSCKGYSLAIQTDGKILAAGQCTSPYPEFAVVRFNSSGSLDASFGIGGLVITPIDSNKDNNIQALKIQPDGKFITAGYASYGGCCAGPYEFALVRYNPDGSLDTAAGPITQPPSADSLSPVNIYTAPGTAQTFTAVYSDPDGWADLSDVSLLLSGITHNEWVDYNPQTNKFNLLGADSDCSPGETKTVSNHYLNLNCGASSASGSGTMLTVVYRLTPRVIYSEDQPSLSGAPYLLVITAVDQGGSINSKTTGTWIINRPPSAVSVSPMNSMGGAGMGQMFTAIYYDPDGWQNIAAANFYLAGNGGMHNEWLHYLSAPNLFTMMGTNDVCTPGQATTLSNGFLTLDCGASSISGSGNTLTVIFQLTPEMSSSGVMYDIFTAASDHAGAAHGLYAGTWQIQ